MLGRAQLLLAVRSAGPRGPQISPSSFAVATLLQPLAQARQFSPSARAQDVDVVAAAAPVVAAWMGPVDVFAEYLKLVHSATGLPWCVRQRRIDCCDPASWSLSESRIKAS